jgi:hypothetical protein
MNINLVTKLIKSELLTLTKLALKYNPGTRALADTLIDQGYNSRITEQLLISMNPFSVFPYNTNDVVLCNKSK